MGSEAKLHSQKSRSGHANTPPTIANCRSFMLSVYMVVSDT